MLEPIEVRRHGSSGPTVVVLHGGPGAAGSAVGIARLLAPTFRVLEPMQRGSGSEALTVARHVEDLAAVAPAAAVVGWSSGAMLGLSYAARFPAKVKALVLVGCGTYSEVERCIYRERLDVALGAVGRAQRDALNEALRLSSDAAERNRILGDLGELLTRAQNVDVDPEETPVVVDTRAHEETWADLLRLQALGEEPASFATIRSPVLLLHGEDDPHPGTETAATLRRVLPQLEYVSLARCGHEPWRERGARREFERVLVGWLRKRAE